MAEALPDQELFQSTLASISKSADSVANLLSEASSNLPDYSNGISLLSLKNSVLLSYMHNMALLALCRLEGRSLENDEQVRKTLVERLIRERVILERIKPLEARLKYQVDKLITKADNADRIEREGGRPEDDEDIGNGEYLERARPMQASDTD
jgi:U3 small nucleolar ribonucleoprotein protein LCP5